MELLGLLSDSLANRCRLRRVGVDLTEEVRQQGRLGLHEADLLVDITHGQRFRRLADLVDQISLIPRSSSAPGGKLKVWMRWRSGNRSSLR